MIASIYAGRKHLGPLDRAQINAAKSRENLIKSAILQEIVNDIEHVNEQLSEEDLPKTDELMLQLLKSQLNKQLCDFLGVPEDERTSTNS